MTGQFSLLQVPKVEFGAGSLKNLSLYLGEGRVLFVLGRTISRNPGVVSILKSLEETSRSIETAIISGEPGVSVIDEISSRFYGQGIGCVVGIGGGSVLDTAKALSVMLHHKERREDPALSVKAFLEGVGSETAPPGRLPLALIPSTAGTGSETTKNAVISQVGPDGFKKSLRHDTYLPDVAIIDPSLHLDLPLEQTAASALDALTQLMESYVSVKSTIFTDSLLLPAIHSTGKALDALLDTGELDNLAFRSDLSYGAFISGIGLAHAGLTYVHGLSGPMGAVHHIPHGVACALLIAKINRAMVESAGSQPEGQRYLSKMSAIAQGWGVRGPQGAVRFLEELEKKARLKRVRDYGFTDEQLIELSHLNCKRNSPVTIPRGRLEEILLSL